MTITNTTPGSLIAIRNAVHPLANTPKINHRIYEVKRATDTQVVACNIHNASREIRVRIATGRVIEKPGFEGALWAIDATAEILAQHEIETAAYNRCIAARHRMHAVESAIHYGRLTTEQMEAIATAYEATLPTEPAIAP